MNENIFKVFELTKEIKQTLEYFPLDDNRDEYIDKINTLIEVRGEAIKCIPKNINEEDKAILIKTAELYEEVNFLFEKFLSLIEADILKTSQKRRFQKEYLEKTVITDGMFFDKRK